MMNILDQLLKNDFIVDTKESRAYFWKETNGHYVVGFFLNYHPDKRFKYMQKYKLLNIIANKLPLKVKKVLNLFCEKGTWLGRKCSCYKIYQDGHKCYGCSDCK